jgi:hypothetical protein
LATAAATSHATRQFRLPLEGDTGGGGEEAGSGSEAVGVGETGGAGRRRRGYTGEGAAHRLLPQGRASCRSVDGEEGGNDSPGLLACSNGRFGLYGEAEMGVAGRRGVRAGEDLEGARLS